LNHLFYPGREIVNHCVGRAKHQFPHRSIVWPVFFSFRIELCLQYPSTPVSLTATLSDKVEIPGLLLTIFRFAASVKSREQCRLRFWRLR